MKINEIINNKQPVLNESALRNKFDSFVRKIKDYSKDKIIRIISSIDVKVDINKLKSLTVKSLAKALFIILILSQYSSVMPSSYSIETATFTYPAEKETPLNCGIDELRIQGNLLEKEYTCKAFNQIIEYFGNIGLEIEDSNLTVQFRDVVEVSRVEGGPMLKVMGYYDNDTKEIFLTGFNSNTDMAPWGLDWNKDVANSILQHELAHWAANQTIDQNVELDTPWHECLAYIVQFDLMDSNLLDSITQNYPNLGAHRSMGINDLTYSMDPDQFAYQCHRTAQEYHENEGKNLVAEVLSGRKHVRINVMQNLPNY